MKSKHKTKHVKFDIDAMFKKKNWSSLLNLSYVVKIFHMKYS